MGIDDLRGYNFVRGGALPCYANSKTLADIQHIFSYIFKHDPDYLGGAKPKLELHQIVLHVRLYRSD